MIAYHLRTKSQVKGFNQSLYSKGHRDEGCKCSVDDDEDVIFISVRQPTWYWRCLSCVTQTQIDNALKKGKAKEGVAAIVTCEDFDGFDTLSDVQQHLVHDKLDRFFPKPSAELLRFFPQVDSNKRKREDATLSDSALNKATRTISVCLQDLVANSTEDIRKSLLLEVAKKDDEIHRLTKELKAATDRWEKVKACYLVVQNNVQ
jgi:hypothetical protein